MPQVFRLAAMPVAVVISAILLLSTASAQTNGSPERYTATAINMNNGSAGAIDISVGRWSTDKERDALIAVIMEKGPEKLLDALQDSRPTGHFGAPGNLSWDLRFATKVALPEGSQQHYPRELRHPAGPADQCEARASHALILLDAPNADRVGDGRALFLSKRP